MTVLTKLKALAITLLAIQGELATGQVMTGFRTNQGTNYLLATSDTNTNDALLASFNDSSSGLGPITPTSKCALPTYPVVQFLGNCAPPPPSSGGGGGRSPRTLARQNRNPLNPTRAGGTNLPQPTASSTVMVSGCADNNGAVSPTTDPLVLEQTNSVCSSASKAQPSFLLAALGVAVAVAANSSYKISSFVRSWCPSRADTTSPDATSSEQQPATRSSAPMARVG